ncbi:hypothetical protein ACO0LD_30840 [Undibacterium sp. Ji83W]|uniref:hypothetical protein n=1 Tax=Undibacterium sp. Ji83W TaxID=3413043 RepID=UPI003BF25C63
MTQAKFLPQILHTNLTRFAVPVFVVFSFATNLSYAALAVPTLNEPSNGISDWLFNLTKTGDRQPFSWSGVSGAAGYEFVLSRSPNFAGYDDANSTCLISSCKAVKAARLTASAANLNNFYFEAATYYWKVRAYTNTSKGAWSVTRSFTTSSRSQVVTQAMSYSNSPQSRIDRTDGGSVTWLTELDVNVLSDNVDGKLLENAQKIYGLAKLPRNLGTATAPTQLRKDMKTALVRKDGWEDSERDKLVVQIATTFVPASVTRNGLLSNLGIRAQCKEFADRMVIAGGGKPKNYSAMGTAKRDVRPGMYIIWKSKNHAAIANSVKFDSSGNAFARLSEANWGSEWKTNPYGQIPWQRTIGHSREVQIFASGDYLAYEN